MRIAIAALDSFHHDDRVLHARGCRSPRKGTPFIFDVEGYAVTLGRLRAPAWDAVAVPDIRSRPRDRAGGGGGRRAAPPQRDRGGELPAPRRRKAIALAFVRPSTLRAARAIGACWSRALRAPRSVIRETTGSLAYPPPAARSQFGMSPELRARQAHRFLPHPCRAIESGGGPTPAPSLGDAHTR